MLFVTLEVTFIVMYSVKAHTRKISISILKYSILYTRPTFHCNIDSVKPPQL